MHRRQDTRARPAVSPSTTRRFRVRAASWLLTVSRSPSSGAAADALDDLEVDARMLDHSEVSPGAMLDVPEVAAAAVASMLTLRRAVYVCVFSGKQCLV